METNIDAADNLLRVIYDALTNFDGSSYYEKGSLPYIHPHLWITRTPLYLHSPIYHVCMKCHLSDVYLKDKNGNIPPCKMK